MKRNHLLLITFYFFIFVIPGFSQIKIGPLVGVNLSGLSIDPDVPGRNINTKSGLTAGATIIYNFSSMFGVQLEPAYTQGGASVYSAQTDDGLILEIEQTIEMNYIDIPVLFKVSFAGDFIAPYLLAGANIGFPLDDTKVTINNLTVNGEDFTEFIPSEVIEQNLKNEGIDYGLNFGAGISFPLGAIDMFIQAQYNLGLTDLNDEAPQDGVQQDVIKNRGFQVTTGVLFSL